MPQDVLSFDYRKQIIDEILGEENKKRKLESFKKFEVYRKRQAQFIDEKLTQEYSAKKAQTMRKITSINMTKKIINDLASIYNTEPKRVFDSNEEYLNELYDESQVNIALKKANKYFKLDDQCAIQVIPVVDKFKLRVLARYQYDVVPLDQDPEIAAVYIISNFDETGYIKSGSDSINQKIADLDDKKLDKMRLTWWSAEWNLVTDGHGNILFQAENPIQKLNFVDVSTEKDMEFFIRNGSGIVDFSLDLGVILSDVATINRMQGYAQAILYAKDAPQEMIMGAQQVLFLPLDENSEKEPKFEFANPSPDLNASLALIDKYVQLFLSAEGIDPKKMSGEESFKSGFERLLAMLSQFEATKDDFDKFKDVEAQVFDLFKAWSEFYSLKKIDDNAKLEVIFHSPEMVQTRQDVVDENIKLVESGLRPKLKAIQVIDNVDEDTANKILHEIETEGLVGAMNGQSNV